MQSNELTIYIYIQVIYINIYDIGTALRFVKTQISLLIMNTFYAKYVL